jgi:hypothetical protein
MDLLNAYFSTHVQSDTGLMNIKLRDTLCKSAEKIFKTASYQKLPLASMSLENAIDVVINEIVQSPTYEKDFQLFLDQQREELSAIVWTPQLEFSMTQKSTTFHAHLLKTMGSEWRYVINHYSIPLLLGQPFPLRETMKEKNISEWKGSNFIESNVWFRHDKRWTRFTTLETLAEPPEFSDAITFQSCPSSKNVLALFPNRVKLGRLGGKVFGEFEHDIEEANFLDCFVLSTGAVIVKIGHRNALTGGLKDEMAFSFRYGKSDYDCVPYTLSKEEESEIQAYYQEQHTLKDMSSSISVVNTLGGAPYLICDAEKYVQSTCGICCGVVGNADGFLMAFYDGRIRIGTKEFTVNTSITHIIYQA